MSSINYGALRGESETAPPAGMYDAFLVRARLQTGRADFIVTEWQADRFYWETLYGFTTSRMQFTQDALDGLKVDRSTLTSDDDLEAQLADAAGHVYRVRVERNGIFVNTYIEGSAHAVEPDVPVDASDLPDVVARTLAPPPMTQPALTGAGPPSTPVAEEDDIPFAFEPFALDFEPWHAVVNR
jgi:hypothetical protein